MNALCVNQFHLFTVSLYGSLYDYIIHEALISTLHDCAYHWLLASNLLWMKPVYVGMQMDVGFLYPFVVALI